MKTQTDTEKITVLREIEAELRDKVGKLQTRNLELQKIADAAEEAFPFFAIDLGGEARDRGLKARRKLQSAIDSGKGEGDEACRWVYDGCLEYYNTSCGDAFTLIAETLEDNHMKFCCYCGKKIEETKIDEI